MQAAQVATPPAAPAVTLEEIRLHCRVDGYDEDVYLQSLVTAATDYLQSITGRIFVTTALELALPAFPATHIVLPGVPLVTAASIAYTDPDGATQSLTLAGEDYQIDTRALPGRIQPAYAGSWPTTRDIPNAVVVSYVAGHAAVVTGSDGNLYRCKLQHTSATATNKPITGTDYLTFWEAIKLNGAAVTVGAARTWADATLYRDVPDRAKSAIRFLVAHWFEHRESVTLRSPPPVPFSVASIIANLKIWGVQ